MGKSIVLAIFIFAVLCGCAVSRETQISYLAKLPSCCHEISEIPIQDCLGSQKSFEIGDQSPVFDFRSGRSQFAAIELPENVSDKKLELRSFLQHKILVDGDGGYTFFFPVATFLDDKRQEISTAFDDEPKFETGGNDATTAIIALINVPSVARYVIVHTFPKKIGELYGARHNYQSQGWATMIGGILIFFPPSHDEHIAKVIYTSKGRVMVSILN